MQRNSETVYWMRHQVPYCLMGPQNPTNQLHLPGCFPQAFRSLDCHLVLALYGLEADRDHHCETKEGHHLFAYVTLMSRLFNLGEFQLFDNSVTLSYPGNITYIFGDRVIPRCTKCVQNA